MRNAAQTTIVGQKNTGKTTMILEKVIPFNGKKTLIVDTLYQESWRHVKPIDIKLINAWKANDYKFILSKDLKERKEQLNYILQNISNCNLILEDTFKYIKHHTTDQELEILADCKNKNVDLYLMFHSLAQIPIRVREYEDYFILFKTLDSAQVCNRFADKEKLKEIYYRVNKHKSHHYCEFIDYRNKN